ncbi:hypothetical protein M3Y99_01177300 [Aphelenchoides fujianensis]|nr:hypothetical protein M3Y99_01177300 [Aphelenchoides fujianensis]
MSDSNDIALSKMAAACRTTADMTGGVAEVLERVREERTRWAQERAEFVAEQEEARERQREWTAERKELARQREAKDTEVRRLNAEKELLETEKRVAVQRAENAEKRIADLERKQSEDTASIQRFVKERQEASAKYEAFQRDYAQMMAKYKEDVRRLEEAAIQEKAELFRQHTLELQKAQRACKEALAQAKEQVDQLRSVEHERDNLRRTNKMLLGQTQELHKAMNNMQKPPKRVVNRPREYLHDIEGSSIASDSTDRLQDTRKRSASVLATRNR